MEFVKYNQLLKIRVEYDQDYGQIGFNDFIEDNGLEPIGEHAYAYFPNEPRWTESEINGMTEEERLVCDRLTEVLHLLGLTALSVKWFNTRAQIQRKHKGHTEAGMSMTGPIELKVTV